MLSQLQEFHILYAAATTFLAEQSDSGDYHEDTAVEKALEVIHMYESSLKVRDSISFKEILRLPDKPL